MTQFFRRSLTLIAALAGVAESAYGSTPPRGDQHGRIDGVRYDELAPMLLNEMQKDRTHEVAQDEIIALQNQKIVSLEGTHSADAATIERQAERIASLERKIAAQR